MGVVWAWAQASWALVLGLGSLFLGPILSFSFLSAVCWESSFLEFLVFLRLLVLRYTLSGP